MAVCSDCLHYVCCERSAETFIESFVAETGVENVCRTFKDKSRLVVLPCKIGETVFCILHSKNEVVADVVVDYDIWSIKDGVKLRISLLNHNDYVVAEFGKTVFLTREEAEAALAERKDGNE